MRKILYLLMLCGLTAAAGSLSAAPGTLAGCDGAGNAATTDAFTRQVLRALVAPEEGPPRVALLEQYLAAPSIDQSSARQVARNHARVVLAAERIRDGQHEAARQLLSQVDLASPVAVDAALLLAESYRLQGNDAQSQAWLVRVAQRYSSDPQALSGLLLSARDLAESGKVREAWALYNLINDKVLNNVEQMSSMRSSTEAMVDQLLETRLDESRSVASQLMKNILQSPEPGTLASMREVLEARRRLECLTREEETLKDEAWDESIQHANVASFQTMLETEARINRHQMQDLEAQLAAAPPREKPLIEEEIAALREHMASLEDRVAELKARQAELPADSLSQQKELERHIAGAQKVVEENRDTIREQLDQALLALQERYRELAAETQLARAELMQILVSSR